MDNYMEYSKDNKFIPVTSVTTHIGGEIAQDLYYFTIQIVNICLFGNPEQKDEWVLIDTGMPKSADDILSLVERRFGSNSRPKAIILTHGHFDHVGAVVDLVRHWDVPVFAHELELPYLTGNKSYPEPDSTVEGGLVAKMSPIFPNEPINLESNVEQLPSNGTVPGMHGWRWIHTPGHSPGHISLFRDEDRSLIVGDAFVTVRQDSLYKVLVQKQEICGPPRYLTTDWHNAWESVKKLEALKPKVAVTGHGTPMTGELLSNGLRTLVQEFDRIAIPDYGRYIN
ncbi:MBL fold metallo-hydrolase [Bacillus sp. FJAT-29790]|uniref:MBL fold metallo-hydrolase n=1 Tax=Bacillus sp. FJAT-29790 TaxID=1895002 RepID=UPI001C23F638|nr:MBL fold metallo-hydrolase [Bacillus sp. FJAT-29790]MBU8878823.1 MBL fold metallo-hydrolase [Bacillus sp. FJAT-29790]